VSACFDVDVDEVREIRLMMVMFGIDSLDEGAGSSVYFDLFYVDFEGVRHSVTRRGVVDGKVKTSFTPGWLCSLGVDMEVAMNVHP